MVISTIIRTFLIEANKAPHVQLTTIGVEITVIEEYWKDDLLHLCCIMAHEGSTMRLPGDDVGQLRLVEVNVLEHVIEFDWERHIDAALGAEGFLFVRLQAMVAIRMIGSILIVAMDRTCWCSRVLVVVWC